MPYLLRWYAGTTALHRPGLPDISLAPTDPVGERPLITVSDFAYRDGGNRPTGHLLIGDKPIPPARYTIVPMTSTVAGLVPAQGTGKTNPVRLVRAGGNGSGTRMAGLTLADIDVNATEQGHQYGGVQILWTSNLVVERFGVSGIRGNANGPPGETFNLEVYEAQSPIVRDCHLDGRINGVRQSSTLFGFNNCSNALLETCSGRDNKWGMAVAMWMGEGHTVINNFDARYCAHPINFEQYLGGGLVEMNNLDVRNQQDEDRPHVTFNSARGSSDLVCVEPIWDENLGPFHVGIATPGSVVGWGTTNQLREDLTVIKGGINITNTSRVRIGY